MSNGNNKNQKPAITTTFVDNKEVKPQEPARRIVDAISLIRTTDGWVSLKYKIQGDKVIGVDASEPDLKLISQEKFLQNAGRIATSDGGVS